MMFHSWLLFCGRVATLLVASMLCLHGIIFQKGTTTSLYDDAFEISLKESIGNLRLSSNNKHAVKVDVYVESLCIDSKEYILNQLVPTYETLGPVVMDLNIVVFGNARIDDSSSTSLECQHGEAECDANSYEQCAADIYGTAPGRYLNYVACLFDRLPMGHSDIPFETSIFASCATASTLAWEQIKNCHSDTDRTWELQKQAADETPSEHRYVPWVLLNSEHINEEDDLLPAICKAYIDNGGSHPACDNITYMATMFL